MGTLALRGLHLSLDWKRTLDWPQGFAQPFSFWGHISCPVRDVRVVPLGTLQATKRDLCHQWLSLGWWCYWPYYKTVGRFSLYSVVVCNFNLAVDSWMLKLFSYSLSLSSDQWYNVNHALNLCVHNLFAFLNCFYIQELVFDCDACIMVTSLWYFSSWPIGIGISWSVRKS